MSTGIDGPYNAEVDQEAIGPVEITGDTPQTGTQVTADGRDAGEVRSLAGGLALALIRRDKLDLFVEQGVPLVAGNATLTPRLPEWQSI